MIETLLTVAVGLLGWTGWQARRMVELLADIEVQLSARNIGVNEFHLGDIVIPSPHDLVKKLR